MHDGELFVGGNFGTADGLVSAFWAHGKTNPEGDMDDDCDVDLGDFAGFSSCFNGANRPPIGTSCGDADTDADGDVDLDDFTAFSACFNGSNRLPAC